MGFRSSGFIAEPRDLEGKSVVEEVELEQDGWWCVWDISKGYPIPLSTFKYNHEAREWVAIKGNHPHLEIKRISKK